MKIEKDWNQRSSYELIQLFQDKKQPESVRNSSFYALVIRFRDDVLQKCEIICKSYGHDITVAEQITESTFSKYLKNGAFDFEKSNSKDVDHSFRLYLYGISQKELFNFYRNEERKKKGYYYNGTEKIVEELPNISELNLSIEERIRIEAIKSLPKSHQAVYLTYSKYEISGFNLPRKLQKELREYLGVKQNTIRTYKKEAKDKINEYLRVMKITQNQI